MQLEVVVNKDVFEIETRLLTRKEVLDYLNSDNFEIIGNLEDSFKEYLNSTGVINVLDYTYNEKEDTFIYKYIVYEHEFVCKK